MKKLISIYIFCSVLSSQDYSVRFDGINDYAYVLDHPDLDLTSNYTLEAWIFPESFSWLSGIISKYHTNGSNGYTLRLNQDPPYTGLGFDELEISFTNNIILNTNNRVIIEFQYTNQNYFKWLGYTGFYKKKENLDYYFNFYTESDNKNSPINPLNEEEIFLLSNSIRFSLLSKTPISSPIIMSISHASSGIPKIIF